MMKNTPENEMKKYFEEYYSMFISKVKEYICSAVKMGSHKGFFKTLNIQLLVKPVTNFIPDSNDTDSLISKNSLLNPASYWVTEEKVEQTDHGLSASSLSKENEKVIASSDKVGPFMYKLTWFVDNAKNFDFVEKYFVETLLKILMEKVNMIDFFETAPLDTIMSGICFMSEYYNLIQKDYNLPDKDLISKMSYRTYENRENRGIMCFVSNEARENLKSSVRFSKSSIDEAGFVEENIDNMRKILEIAKPGFEGDEKKCMLFDSNNKQCWGLILEEKVKREKDYLLIYFQGTGKWEVKHNDKVVFKSNNNVLAFDSNSRTDLLRAKLPEQINAQSLFIDLIDCLENQQHGALVIIAPDAESEMERLCDKFKRGTKIKKLLINTKETLSVISGFCSVDGAIFMDYEGYCHGYGVILDGEAKVKGVRGRGARYNSARNYIMGSERYAIIVSEDKDKDIEILSPSK